MSSKFCAHAAHLQLHVSPTEEPHLRRSCPRCRGKQRFICSGKFRVNANGKTIDAWLIYRCEACDQTWNYPIHERRMVKSFDAEELNALMQNDPDLASRYAHDIDRLRGAGVEVLPALSAVVSRMVLQPATEQTQEIIISIALIGACRIRLDRLLAEGLSLQRSDVAVLFRSSALDIHPASPKALKRAAINDQVVRLDLSRCSKTVAAICCQSLIKENV